MRPKLSKKQTTPKPSRNPPVFDQPPVWLRTCRRGQRRTNRRGLYRELLRKYNGPIGSWYGSLYRCWKKRTGSSSIRWSWWWSIVTWYNYVIINVGIACRDSSVVEPKHNLLYALGLAQAWNIHNASFAAVSGREFDRSATDDPTVSKLSNHGNIRKTAAQCINLGSVRDEGGRARAASRKLHGSPHTLATLWKF